MTAAQADLAGPPDKPRSAAVDEAGVRLDTPRIEDGAAIWRIARDSGSLDLNSSYSYLLWCRDFADTTVVARDVLFRGEHFPDGHEPELLYRIGPLAG